MFADEGSQESLNNLKKDHQRVKKRREEKENELLAYQSFYGHKQPDDDQGIKHEEETLDRQFVVFNETSKEQENRIRKESPFGNLLTWKLLRIIVKANDDVR